MSDDVEGGAPSERLLTAQQHQQQQQQQQQPNNNQSTPIVVETSNVEGPCCSCMAERLNVTRHQYIQCDDEPPPYASLMDTASSPSWSYVFPVSPYEDTGGGGSGSGVGGATSTENRAIARPLVSIPLTSYGIYKLEPPRYASVVVGPLERHPRLMPETVTAVKAPSRTARKYGAILIAATVIIFLMVLSLMVRFVTKKSLWRG